MSSFFQSLSYKSLAFKSAIIYFIIFLAGLSMVGLLMLRYSSKSIIESAESNIKHTADIIQVKLEEYLRELESDILYLSTSPDLNDYIVDPSLSNEASLSDNYLALLKSKTDYSQIRFIWNDGLGSEAIRVERKKDSCFILDKPALQSKGDRPYFRESLYLSPYKTYFSPIDLNKEFGKISLPHTPTLRVAKSIQVNDEIIGVVVINTNLSKLFESLANTVDENYFLRILNQAGYYLMHENKDSTFLFEFDRPAKSQFDFRKLKNQTNRLYEMDNDRVMAYQHINYGDKQEGLVYFVIADKNKALASYRKWRKDSVYIILFIGLLFTLLAFYTLTKQTRTLVDITKRLKEFPYNREIKNLPVNRQDEIGGLAKSLNEMAVIINQQIDSVKTEKTRAENAVQEKAEFLENISHEIRNPLHSIMGLSNMLENNNPSPNQIDIINSLKFNTSNLLGLVNNILDYQNVLKGDIQVNYSWVNVPKLVSEVAMGNRYSAVEREINLDLRFDERLTQFDFKIDKLRLSQILSNLISNAIKFTQAKGSVLVIGELISKSEEEILRLSVKDTGIGMNPDEVERIKERYFTNKGVQTLTSNFGLGLTIVSELLSLLGSKIKVHSKKNEGSVFFFDLTLEKRRAFKEDLVDDQIELEGIDVIVIEDDIQIVALYKHLLKQQSPEPIYLQDYSSIHELDKQFDLVISDFRFTNNTMLDQLPSLELIMKPGSSLVISSASYIDLSVLNSKVENLYFIQKPFTPKEFKDLLYKAVFIPRFGKIDTEGIKRDYDYQKEKYQRALNILISEWGNISETLYEAFLINDKDSMEATLHKFITTLRRLKLSGLEKWLVELKEQIPNSSKTSQAKSAKTLKQVMSFYHYVLKNNF